jgi:RimJ/RimL family protein N-acetyltransferase
MSEQPLGNEIKWVPARRPHPLELHGRTVLLRPLDAAADAGPLFAASHLPAGDPAVWTYLFDGPYASAAALRTTLEIAEASVDPLFFTIVPLPGERPAGYASLMRITPEHGTIEIGNVMFGAALQRTTAATEAIFLLARHAFDELGYRRLEWKCNALNAPSRAAAERFGFLFEGVFAQHLVIKGRNRDTVWYAITDRRWPAIRKGFETWLAPENFDAAGAQRRSLRELTAET